MIKIKTLTRYPIKSLSGENKNKLSVNRQGKIELDRIAAFRLGNNSDYDGKWKSKINYLSLMHVPYLSLIQLTFDDKRKIISIKIGEEKKERFQFSEMSLIEEKIKEFLMTKGFNKKFRLIFPKDSSSFHDSETGLISLHSEASENELKSFFEDADGTRFRTNIVVKNSLPFEELDWIGKKLIIGNLTFKVTKSITRCMAVNCNPEKGIYDLNILKMLPKLNQIKEPTFGVKLELVSGPGLIKIKDKVSIL
jgi:uncharacterized protein YcbX